MQLVEIISYDIKCQVDHCTQVIIENVDQITICWPPLCPTPTHVPKIPQISHRHCAFYKFTYFLSYKNIHKSDTEMELEKPDLQYNIGILSMSIHVLAASNASLKLTPCRILSSM